MRDERRREEPALVELLRLVGRDELRRLAVRRDLVGGDRHHDPDGSAAPVAEQARVLEADALGLAFERGVQDLHPLLGHIERFEVAPTRRLLLGARGPPVVVVVVATRRVAFGEVAGVELFDELVELGLGLGELELELVRVDALGLREEDAPAKKLELPLQ